MKVIPVTKKEKVFFADVAPEYIRSALALPTFGGLGAIDEETEESLGLIVYSFDNMGGIYIRWMYVDEKCRNRGVGGAMLDALFTYARVKDFDGLYVVLTPGNEGESDSSSLEDYFRKKSFSNKISLPDRRIISAGKLTSLPFFEKAERKKREKELANIRSLHDIGSDVIKSFLESNSLENIDVYAFEGETSCGVFYGTALKGLLLVYKADSLYMPVYLSTDKEEDKVNLLMYSMIKAASILTDSEAIAVFPMNEEEERLCRKILLCEGGSEAFTLEAELH
ncbi:MAG: GNAT family N-acetyltransferase [Lachnospiraceae bacterium]|nr:GNAT family N-acetyltransferase [Lachnospiraceae bacterium]